jgi:hypothetical protein
VVEEKKAADEPTPAATPADLDPDRGSRIEEMT